MWTRRLYAILPWGIILLGLLHMAATWKIYAELTPAALWFFSGGIVLVFTGALNLVNARHGAAAPALRRLCQGVNIVTLAFSAVSGVVGGAGVLTQAIVVGLFGAVTVLSLLPRSTP